jgi:hypothetical protein
MAAFTEGFTDTSGQKDHIGAAISKVLAARQMAEEERKHALEELQKQDPDATLEDFGIRRGYFFKKALAHEFGGDFIDRKKDSVRKLIDKRKLLKDPKALKTEVKGFIKEKFNQKLDPKKVARFRTKFDYNLTIDNPLVNAGEEAVPSTAKKTAKSASGSKGSKISKEELLASVADLARSLEKTAQSIGKTAEENAGIASGIQSMNQSVVTEISQRTSTLENKLDAIANAINNQTAFQKQNVDKAEDVATETRSEKISDSAGIVKFDDLSTKEDESSFQLDNYNQTNVTVQQQNNEAPQVPQAEQGGIISGPDSGYNVRLHGDEMIVPLNNNYTQGEPSAVDGVKRPKPKYEMGTVAKSPAMPSIKPSLGPTRSRGESVLGGKVGFQPLALPKTSTMGTAGMDKLSQPLMDAMSLPMMVAGGTVLSATSKFMTQLGPAGKSIAGEIGKVSRPIADIFGLPNTIASKSAEPSLLKGDDTKDPNKKEEKKDKKGMFSKILTTLNKVFTGGGNGGGGGGNGGGGNDGREIEYNGDPGTGAPGELLAENAKTTYYDPSLGGINASGIKTKEGLPATSTGEGYKPNLFTAAAFPELIAKLPRSMTVPSSGFPGGRTLKSPFHVIVTNAKNGKKAVVRVNDVGSGTASHKKNHMLDLSVAAKDYLGTGEGYKIEMAQPGAKQGPLIDKPDASRNDTAIAGNPKSQQESQSITQNFGYKTHEKLNFTYQNERYHGYKTANGWDIYKEGGLGGVKIDTSGGKNAGVVKALMDAGNQAQQHRNIKPPESTASALNNSGASKQTASALTPASKSSTGKVTLSPIFSPTGQRSSNANTSAQPSAQNALAPGRAPALDAYYNPNSITA